MFSYWTTLLIVENDDEYKLMTIHINKNNNIGYVIIKKILDSNETCQNKYKIH